MKYLSDAVMSLLLLIWIGATFWMVEARDWHPFPSFLASFFGVMLTYLVVAAAGLWLFYRFIMYCPIKWQRPLYNLWKQKLLTKQTHPLVDYPLKLWVEAELDGHFEKGGLRMADAEFQKWLGEFRRSLMEVSNLLKTKEKP